MFSIGLVIYFAARTGLLIVYSFWREANANLVNVGTFVVLSACLLYWLIFINRAGEEAPARIGHSWGTEVQQQRVMAQLEAMNATLLRAARR